MITEEEQKLLSAEATLRTGTKKCKDELRILASKVSSTSLELFEESFEMHCQEIFRTIGDYLYEAAQNQIEDPIEKGKFQFYFWPGYKSIFRSPEKNRIMLNRFLPEHEVLGDFSLPCGIAYPRRGDLKSEELFSTSFWFDTVLGSNIEEKYNGEILTSGSTHLWLTEGSPRVWINTKDGRKESPLNIIQIQVCDFVKDVFGIKKKFGIVNINLIKSDISNWGKTISDVLNNPEIFNSNFCWPYPYPRAEPMDWKSYKRLCRSGNGSRKIQTIREKLYNIWLASCFVSNWKDTYSAWLNSFISEDIYNTQLAKKIEERLEVETVDRNYKIWYIISLETPVTEATESELGSLMFLSSHDLPQTFLMLVKRVFEWLYLLIRNLETSAKLQFEAGNEGQLKQARIFAHQTSGMIIVPWLDPERQNLSNYSQLMLWMTKILVTEVWGSAKVNPLSSICYGRDADFPEWEGLNNKEILLKLMSVALLQSIQRAAKAPNLVKDEDINDWNDKVQTIAINLLHEDDCIGNLWKILNIELPQTAPPDWTTKRGFVLCFYHCLWQSAYHALKASLESNHEHYLRLEWNDSRVSIFNRSASVFAASKLPNNDLSGEDIGLQKQITNDKVFLDFLESKLDRKFVIEGPLETEEKNIWVTTILHGGKGDDKDSNFY